VGVFQIPTSNIQLGLLLAALGPLATAKVTNSPLRSHCFSFFFSGDACTRKRTFFSFFLSFFGSRTLGFHIMNYHLHRWRLRKHLMRLRVDLVRIVPRHGVDRPTTWRVSESLFLSFLRTTKRNKRLWNWYIKSSMIKPVLIFFFFFFFNLYLQKKKKKKKSGLGLDLCVALKCQV
jgi:ABC-type amino acid transport system permease subunit